MEPFTSVTGVAACLPREDINTGAIIPARFMRSLDEDLGKALFGDWRYDALGRPNKDFVLNRPPYTESRFIVAGANFGCGSSREAAVWALRQFGMRAVMSSSFGDLFYENAFKNGLLPVVLEKPAAGALLDRLARPGAPALTVDLVNRQVVCPPDLTIPFSISDTRRRALMQGLDEIGATLERMDEIAAFRATDRKRRPWIYP